MPTPARTSIDSIVAAGRGLLESDGMEAVTMQRVAAAVGVRAPSLYKHVRDHADLMHRIANDVGAELAQTLDRAADAGNPQEDLRRIAAAFRAWAHGSPSAYALLTSAVPEEWRPDADLNARMSAAVLAATGQIVGTERALDAARTFVAFAHGFISLELAGGFRLGGDPSSAYEFGVSTLINAMAQAR